LESSADQPREHTDTSRIRTIRLRLTNLKARPQRVNVVGTLPVTVIKAGLRFGVELIPQLNSNAVRDLLRAIDSGPLVACWTYRISNEGTPRSFC